VRLREAGRPVLTVVPSYPAFPPVAPGRTIRRVEALRSGRVLAFERDGAAVRFELPAVTDYEVVAIT
jgi:hypothetical protein